LATTYPASNAGFLGWTKLAYGDLVSFLDGYVMTMVVMLDQALYPVIFMAYFDNIPGIDISEDVWLRFGLGVMFIGVSFIITVMGIDKVGMASNVFGLLTLTPFVIFVIVAIAYGNFDTSIWFQTEADYIDVPLYFSVVIWACCGYEYAGFLAADVRKPERTFPIAMGVTVLMMVGTYLIPVAVGIATFPPEQRSEITEGYYPIMANHLGIEEEGGRRKKEEEGRRSRRRRRRRKKKRKGHKNSYLPFLLLLFS
jgi:amino acid transporter